MPFNDLRGPVRALRPRHKNEPPFDLPPRWVQAEEQARPEHAVQLRLHRGHHRRQLRQPVINRDGEVVGLIFDGNIQSLVLDFAYTDVRARALSVHSRSITEALQHVYGAPELVNELLGSRSRLPVDR